MGHGSTGIGDWSGGIQLEGSREQSYVPVLGHCAQEFENAAILNLVTTFLPLPDAPASLSKAHTLLSSPSDGAGSSVQASPPFALVSLQVAGCVICTVPWC